MRIEPYVLEQRLAHVAAGSAENATYYYYLPILHHQKMGIQFEWTAGAGGGTATLTVEATCMGINQATTTSDYSTLTYQDVTSAVFGSASYTDDCFLIDNAGKFSCCTYVRLKLIVANKDASTAWDIYTRQLS